jgi:hypothetical protein
MSYKSLHMFSVEHLTASLRLTVVSHLMEWIQKVSHRLKDFLNKCPTSFLTPSGAQNAEEMLGTHSVHQWNTYF